MVQRKASVHKVEKVVLLAAFGAVLQQRGVDVGAKDCVTVPQFQEVWKALGIPVSGPAAMAIFNKYGQVRGVRPRATHCCNYSRLHVS